jgi:hypothetical protein
VCLDGECPQLQLQARSCRSLVERHGVSSLDTAEDTPEKLPGVLPVIGYLLVASNERNNQAQ